MKQKNMQNQCPGCGCADCSLHENCPVQQFICEECTPSRPAWQGCFYKQKGEIYGKKQDYSVKN